MDGQVGSKNFKRGSFDIDYWRGECRYSRKVVLDEADVSRQIYLLFEGVNTVAYVRVNGQMAGEHWGGYTAFQLDITPLVHAGENILEVLVDNSHLQTVAPLDADFTFYGGIYRDVHLVVKDLICLGSEEYNYKPLKVHLDHVSRESASVTVTAWPENHSKRPVEASLELTMYEGERVAASTLHPVSLSVDGSTAAVESFEILRPHLWNGRKDPFRYRITARLLVDGKRWIQQRSGSACGFSC